MTDETGKPGAPRRGFVSDPGFMRRLDASVEESKRDALTELGLAAIPHRLAKNERWCRDASAAIVSLRSQRNEAEAHVERLTEEWRQQRERAELLERSAAVTMLERDALQKLADGWKAAALNRLGKCGTCMGEGVFEEPIGLDAMEHEVFRPAPCPECDGTGNGDIAHAFASLRLSLVEARADRQDAISVADGVRDRLDEAIGQRDAAVQRAEQGAIEWECVRVAVAEAVALTSDKTEVGQVLRRALGLCR